VLSAQPVPMAAHATMEYVIPSLSKNCTATEEQCFLRGPCRNVISRTNYELQLETRVEAGSNTSTVTLRDFGGASWGLIVTLSA
jgi:hypothetical protein